MAPEWLNLKRPVVFITVCYCIGILTGQYFQNRIVLFALILIALATSAAIYLKWGRLLYIAGVMALVIGQLQHTQANMPKDGAAEALALQEAAVAVTGSITRVDYQGDSGFRGLLRTSQIYHTQEGGVTVIDKPLSIFIQLGQEAYTLNNGEPLIPGQIVHMEGVLYQTDFQRNPGGYNERLTAMATGIDYKFQGALNAVGAQHKDLNYFTYRASSVLGRSFDTVFMEREGAMLKAILLGDKSSLDAQTTQNYRNAGISHILAVSGLHVSILSAIIMKLLTVAAPVLSKRKRAVIALLSLVGYCFLTGCSTSTVRAAWMACIFLMGTVLLRTPDSLTSVAISALAILLIRPMQLFMPGFLLSYSAVIGLIVLSAPLAQCIAFLPVQIRQIVVSTIAASLFTFPITVNFFYSFSLVGLAANLLILPLASLLLLFGLISGVLGLIVPVAAKLFAGVVYMIVAYYDKVTSFASAVSFAIVDPGRLTAAFIICYYSALLCGALYLKAVIAREISEYDDTLALKTVKWRKFTVTTSLFTVLTLLVAVMIPPEQAVVFLDVNQGDCAVITTNDGKCIVIDGGGIASRPIGQNTGIYILLPYLRHKGIKKVDAVIMSHPDKDHAAGLIELIEHMPVETIVLSDVDYGDNEVVRRITASANARGATVTKMAAGDRLAIGMAQFTCYYPNRNQQYTDINNTSLTVGLSLDEHTFLFTGDIEAVDEDAIVLYTNHEVMQTDILKVPHHGSSTSSTSAFVGCIAPTVGIISSGAGNSYGHPAQSVVDQYTRHGVRLLNTADSGAIRIIYKTKKALQQKDWLQIETMAGERLEVQ